MGIKSRVDLLAFKKNRQTDRFYMFIVLFTTFTLKTP
jgi:hypothetical protein